jgi:large subunit ribosomal protein L15
MKQHELNSPFDKKKSRKRVGRGDSSGSGSYSGRGIKGQNSRSGGGVRPNFEGGQLPKSKSMPKLRGFKNRWKKHYYLLNVKDLQNIKLLKSLDDSQVINPELMLNLGLLNDLDYPVKILGDGNIDVPINVEAHRFSSSAIKKIESAGGKVKEML